MASQLDDFLAANSSLTRKQIERMTLQVSLQNVTEDERERETRAELSGVSQGAYYRVLSQAKNNIDQALYTVLLCARIGVIQMDDLRRLLDMVNKAPSELSDEDASQLTALVAALLKRIVML